jgi:hypothetical protein
MQDKSKRNKVILVSIFNFVGFLIQLIFSKIAASNSNDDLLIIISDAISLIWISAFTVKALRHANEPYYPAVALTAMAWPSYLVAFFAFVYLANYLGFKVS